MWPQLAGITKQMAREIRKACQQLKEDFFPSGEIVGVNILLLQMSRTSDTAGPFHIFPIWKSDTLIQDRGHLAEETGGCMRKVGTLASTSVGHERGSYRQEAVSWLEQLSIQGSPAQSQNTEFYYNYIWNLYSLFIPPTANQIFIMLASQLSCKILPAGLFLEVNVTQWKSEDEAKCTCRYHLSGCNCSICKMG